MKKKRALLSIPTPSQNDNEGPQQDKKTTGSDICWERDSTESWPYKNNETDRLTAKKEGNVILVNRIPVNKTQVT